MAGKSKRPKLIMESDELERLQHLRRAPTTPLREVQRAQILARYHAGETVTQIARTVQMTRKSVAKWINRALAVGPNAALKDTYHRPKEPSITEEARAWVVSLACSKPKDLGYAAEMWTRSALANHVRGHAVQAGHSSLAKAVKATVQRILAEQPLHPEKIKYYLERRDPQFDEKMKNVLLVYQAVALQNEQRGRTDTPLPVVTVSVDEKPGLQAIANTAPDLLPVAGQHAEVARDHEYKRLGTCSILAALDLHDGHVTARVERRPQYRIHCLTPGSGRLLSTGVHHPSDPGQPLRAYFEGDPRVLGDPPEPISIRVDAHPRVLAQHRRDPVWEDGADLLETHPREILGRVTRPDCTRSRRDQRRTSGSPLEEVRSPG